MVTKTVISSTTPFCTPQQFASFHDWRPVARLVNDSDAAPQETFQQFLADPNVLAVLQSASGEVEDALLRGTRYTPADLQALAGTNAGAKLAELVANLAFWKAHLHKNPGAPVPEWAQRVLKQLDDLRDGFEIFGFQETAAAGLADVEAETERDVRNRRGVVEQARPYFGRRARDMRQGW